MRKWNRIILSLIVSAILLTSCGTSQDNLKDTQKITKESNTMDFTSVKIGAFTSSNKDDGGWNQVQYAGLTEMLENLGLSDEQFVFIEDVAEEGNSGVATVVQQMAEDGCNIIIGVASGYKDAMDSAASSPAIPQACQEAGVYCTGYHLDMKEYAPEAVMTSFMWNWAPIFEDIVIRFVQDQGIPFQENYFWGADKGCAAIADINLGIVPQEIADKVYKAQEMIISGEIDVFSGELRDNQGNVVVPKGETMSDGKMMDMGFLLDNVIGTLP